MTTTTTWNISQTATTWERCTPRKSHLVAQWKVLDGQLVCQWYLEK
jgi:hypothetical protein